MSRRKRATRDRAERSRSLNWNSRRRTHKAGLTDLQKWLLPNDGIFAELKFHGNTTWSPGSLVWLALYWSWSESRNLTDAFTEAVECCRTTAASAPLTTYQGFMGAMVTWTSTFINLLCLCLQERMEEIG